MRGLLVLIAVLAFAGLVLWVFFNPGTVSLSWFGFHVQTSLFFFVLALGLLYFGLLFVWKIINWILSFPSRVRRKWSGRKSEKAEDTFVELVSSFYAGEINEALRYVKKLTIPLEKNLLFLWFSGTIFTRAGHQADAELQFAKLAQTKKGAFLGLKGQTDRALARGDYVMAREFLEKARELNPESPWVLRTLYHVYVETKHYEDAEKLIDVLEDLSILPAESAKKDLAILQYQFAQEKGVDEAKREVLLRQAHYLHPASSQITYDFAKMLFKQGHLSHAKSAIEATWALKPKEKLGQLYLSMFEDKTPVELYEVASNLAQSVPESDVGKLFKARAALDAKLWGEARKSLGGIHKTTLESLLLLADLEMKEHHDMEKANAILQKALQLTIS